ncbi:MAG TPA: DHH family phosphoesterase [Acidisarcina sp.]
MRVLYHDKCFDGACSASLFTLFHRQCIDPGSSTHYEYQGLLHRAGALFSESDFSGDQNAIVDFKYSPSPRITWWFDHHLSAFIDEADHQQFLDGVASGKFADRRFYDPDYTSCTSFLAHIAQTRFGFDAAPVADLIHWADIVDGALYESPQSAVEMADPAMKLTALIESTQDAAFIPRLIPLLTTRTLTEILGEPFVAPLITPLMKAHHEAIDLIRDRSEYKDGTIYFDLSDQPTEGYNKFIPYYLYPDATYSIGLSVSSFRTKVSVGSNPWTRTNPEQLVNLATICERYGGGGHARVGAISFSPDRIDQARKAAQEIVAELRASNPA